MLQVKVVWDPHRSWQASSLQWAHLLNLQPLTRMLNAEQIWNNSCSCPGLRSRAILRPGNLSKDALISPPCNPRSCPLSNRIWAMGGSNWKWQMGQCLWTWVLGAVGAMMLLAKDKCQPAMRVSIWLSSLAKTRGPPSRDRVERMCRQTSCRTTPKTRESLRKWGT